jgi:hypothetical protein
MLLLFLAQPTYIFLVFLSALSDLCGEQKKKFNRPEINNIPMIPR